MTHGWQSEPTDGSKGGWGSESLILSLCLLFVSVCNSFSLPIRLLVALSIPFSQALLPFLLICVSISLSLYLSIHPSIGLSCCSSIYKCTYICIYSSVYVFIRRSVLLCYLIYLILSFLIDFMLSYLISSNLISSHLIYLSVYLKWSTSAGLPQVDVHSTKTKQFFKTPSILEIDKIKNEAILWDFFQEWKVWVQTWQPRTWQRFAILKIPCL